MPIPTTTLQYSFPQLGSYRNLTKTEVPVPKLKTSEVLVKVHAVSLQYRDLSVAKGGYSWKLPDNLVPCSDMAGEILEVGADVNGWKVGDRVCANFCIDHIHGPITPAIQQNFLGGTSHGVLTKYRAFPAHSLVSVPEHLSYEEASTLPCAAVTAYNALYGPVPVKAGDFVLVLGTGGVSIFALQFAVASGATVIVTSSSDEKLKAASKLGAKHVINYNSTPNWEEEVKNITNGVGVDHVIEVGGPGTLGKSVKSTRMGSGQVHLIGMVANSEAKGFSPLELVRGVVTLRGIFIGSVSQFVDMNRLIIANSDITRPIVDKTFSFDDAINAYAYLESQNHVGKVVIKVAE